jgi:hypothetical protein
MAQIIYSIIQFVALVLVIYYKSVGLLEFDLKK